MVQDTTSLHDTWTTQCSEQACSAQDPQTRDRKQTSSLTATASTWIYIVSALQPIAFFKTYAQNRSVLEILQKQKMCASNKNQGLNNAFFLRTSLKKQ